MASHLRSIRLICLFIIIVFTKLSALTASNQLSATIFDVISNSRYGERNTRSGKTNTDPKVAIGQIGIENCRRLFPILMARPMLRWNDKNIQVLVPKLWQQLVLTSNVAKMRLEEARVRDADSGVLLGTLRTLGSVIIINHFTSAFEDAMVEVMLNYRKANRREEYYACTDVKMNTACLPKVLVEMESIVTRKLLNTFDWPKSVEHLKVAILEDLDQIPILQRSQYGAALAQARAYAIYDGLSRSGLFFEKHKPFWFANVQISGEALTSIRMHAPGKMTSMM
uniref:HDOD domain-containing protein n=1 Tax=Vibrio alfacsensis TaxID=1074311 RepID=UPI001F49344A|nr:HDOD domain-containing protein [Vibrio alfacsensis]